MGFASIIAEEVAAEYRAKTEDAIKRIDNIVMKDLEKIKQEQMVSNYYGGYEQKVYRRTNQLGNSIEPIFDTIPTGNGYDIDFGFDPHPEKMDHSGAGGYELEVTYKRKNGDNVTKTYKYAPDSEDKIFAYFMAGYHKRVGRAGTSPVEEAANKKLDELDEKIDGIIREELSKVK